MSPHPYRVICQTQTPTTLSYLSKWYLTPEAARAAVTQHRKDGWQRVDLVEPGAIPGVSVTGKQVLAHGGINLPRRRTKRGA